MTGASKVAALAAAVAIAASSGAMSAQDVTPYPARAIRLIVPEVPGSAADTIGRTLSTNLATALGQPIVIENKFGAQGIALGIAAPHDGYTLVYGSGTTLALLP